MHLSVHKPSEMPGLAQAIARERLGLGLNLRDAAGVLEEGYASDLLNIDFSARGALGPRPGYEWKHVTITDSVEALFALEHMSALVWCQDTKLTLRMIAGGSSVDTAESFASGSGSWSLVHIGQPDETMIIVKRELGNVYTHDGTGGTWDSSRFGIDDARLLGRTPDGRLMHIGFPVGSTLPAPTSGPAYPAADESMVIVSEPFDPGSTDGDNYFRLNPGDGEVFKACAQLNDRTIVFKQTHLWEINNPGSGSTGKPIFPRRRVDIPAAPLSQQAVCVGPGGLYWVGLRGVYRYDGVNVECISELIEPYFARTEVPFGPATPGLLSTSVKLLCADERLYVTHQQSSTGARRQLVYDLRGEWWSLWDLPAEAMVYSRRMNGLYFSDDGSAWTAARNLWSLTARAISSHWRSNWKDYGNAETKRMQSLRAHGMGEFEVKVYADYQETAVAEQALTGGERNSESPLRAAIMPVHASGGAFSVGIEADTGPLDDDAGAWSVQSIVEHVRVPSGLEDTRRTSA
jgi:hypothetical protein